MSDVPKVKGPASRLFTSDDVLRQTLVADSANYNAAIVNFGHGVRNKFHTHTCDQMLIVTSGKGIVATEQEQRVVEAGDLILVTTGEKHWHGATPSTEFAHITITVPGSQTTQLED